MASDHTGDANKMAFELDCLRGRILAALLESDGFDELYRQCNEIVDNPDLTGLEVIRWRSCEEDPPDTEDDVLILRPNEEGKIGYLDVVATHLWYWTNHEPIGEIKGCLWAEMPRGPK